MSFNWDDWRKYEPASEISGPHWLLINTPRRPMLSVSLAWFEPRADGGLSITPLDIAVDIEEPVVPFVREEDRIVMIMPYSQNNDKKLEKKHDNGKQRST